MHGVVWSDRSTPRSRASCSSVTGRKEPVTVLEGRGLWDAERGEERCTYAADCVYLCTRRAPEEALLIARCRRGCILGCIIVDIEAAGRMTA